MLKASAEILEFINPEKGVEMGELFISDLTANDFDFFQRSLCGKFRTDEFYDKDSLSFNLAYQTFMIAKESGVSSQMFRKRIKDFVAKFRYTVNHWQPDDILKLSEQPKLYPQSWVEKQLREDKHAWSKVQGYEVGEHVLYTWKWENVPLKKFVAKQTKPDFSREPLAESNEQTADSYESEMVKLRKENLKYKMKLEDYEKENQRLRRNLFELERNVSEMRSVQKNENALNKKEQVAENSNRTTSNFDENEK